MKVESVSFALILLHAAADAAIRWVRKFRCQFVFTSYALRFARSEYQMFIYAEFQEHANESNGLQRVLANIGGKEYVQPKKKRETKQEFSHSSGKHQEWIICGISFVYIWFILFCCMFDAYD